MVGGDFNSDCRLGRHKLHSGCGRSQPHCCRPAPDLAHDGSRRNRGMQTFLQTGLHDVRMAGAGAFDVGIGNLTAFRSERFVQVGA